VSDPSRTASRHLDLGRVPSMMLSQETRRICRRLIHPRSWKWNSQKLVCKMPHGPTRWPPYGRPETSRPLKVDHYTLHGRTEMRSGKYAAPREDAGRGNGGRSS
jgi:hypothetical protein